jgi:hypothetical protein
MPAAIIFCQKSRGYAKIGIGSQYGLAKISFNFLGYCFLCCIYTKGSIRMMIKRLFRMMTVSILLLCLFGTAVAEKK